MSLTKEQYDRIMNEYAGIRDRNRHALDRRRMQAYARVPALRELDRRTPALAVDLLRKRLSRDLPAGPGRSFAAETASANPTAAYADPSAGGGPAAPAASGKGSAENGPADSSSTASFRDTAAQITRRRRELLTANGFPADFLEMTWDCPDCHDTGYIGNEKCHCLRRRETSLLYNQSNLDTLAETADFSLLSESFYAGQDLERFRSARRLCMRFAKEFDSCFRNLYLYGTVGTGKTILSVCVAKSLIESGHSVLYFSAASLFDRLADCTFGSGPRDSLREFTDDLYRCDLLIIDDLGTEFTNAFVASSLFTCISERGLNRRPTIISTNLSLQELQTRYSDRVFSRIASSYEICKLTGKDIRLQRRRRRI